MIHVLSQLKDLYGTSIYQTAFLSLRWIICPFLEMEKLIPSEGTILDVGCGIGIFSNLLSLSSSSRNVIGVDISEEKIKIASATIKNRTNIKFIRGDIHSIEINDIHGIVMSDFLHHLPYDIQQRILNKLGERLKENGVLLIKEIDPDDGMRFLMSALSDKLLYPRDKCFFIKQKDLTRYLDTIGFRVHAKKTLKHIPLSTTLYTCNCANNTLSKLL